MIINFIGIVIIIIVTAGVYQAGFNMGRHVNIEVIRYLESYRDDMQNLWRKK